MHYAMQIEPIRKALIIGSPGIEGVDYLYSTSTDVTNIKNHLLSSRGGKWKDNEIQVLWDPGIAELAAIVENTIADYLFVYYAGHGYETTIRERKICLCDADVSDFFLLNNSPRQLIVIDACREKEYPAISGIPEEEEWLPFDGYYPEREAFDNYILQSPVGKKIIHATKSGFASWEDVNGRGGIFTTSLILSARKIQCAALYAPHSIEQSLKKARKIIKQSGDEQEPEIVYSSGNMQVPFAVYVKTEAKAVYSNFSNHNKPRTISRREPSNSGALALGLILLGIVLIANSSD
ncbi:MAG: caspase family protein [Hydrotalea sp. AMD]|nr:MAG: caspase family protein [Sphingobacteriales bacterium]RWZ86228.1 MAG: caspase family protein [Hydrotalea sp. AMD]